MVTTQTLTNRQTHPLKLLVLSKPNWNLFFQSHHLTSLMIPSFNQETPKGQRRSTVYQVTKGHTKNEHLSEDEGLPKNKVLPKTQRSTKDQKSYQRSPQGGSNDLSSLTKKRESFQKLIPVKIGFLAHQVQNQQGNTQNKS